MADRGGRRGSGWGVGRLVIALCLVLAAGAARAQVWSSGNVLLTSPARNPENHFGADSHFGYSLAVGDFDGDGHDDLAVGEPAAWLGALCCQGAVTVFLSGPGRSFTVLTHWYGFLDEQGESAGWTLAAGNFDGTGPDELAVGIPQHDEGSLADVGEVAILYFQAEGVVTQLLELSDFSGVQPGAGWRFGSVMTVGDFDHDGMDDLAVGIPNRANKTTQNAGTVFVAYGGPFGLTIPAQPYIFVEGLGIEGDQAEQRFGAALASGDFDGDGTDDLAVGEPGRDVAGHAAAGEVWTIYGSPTGLDESRTQRFDDGSTGQNIEDGDHYGASLAAGDFNGHLGCDILNDCADDLAVGAPDEDVSATVDAGQLTVLLGVNGVGLSTASAQHITQAPLGNVEAGDGFATNLTAGKLDRSSGASLPAAADDLVVGVPFEDVGSVPDGGVAHLLMGGSGGLSTNSSQVQEAYAEYAVGPPKDHDAFGDPVAIGDFDGDGSGDVAVGIWNHSIDGNSAVGAVQILFGGLCSDGFERGDTSAWRMSP